MARRKYLKDYRIVETLNEKGGIRSSSEYIGEPFRFRNPQAAESMKKRLPPLCILGWIAYAAALLPPSSAGRTAYACLPFLFSAIPLGMLTERGAALLTRKPPLERRSADRFNHWISGGSLMTAVLAGISLVGEAINFFFGSIPLSGGDAVFSAAALILLLCALAIRRDRLRLMTEPGSPSAY